MKKQLAGMFTITLLSTASIPSIAGVDPGLAVLWKGQAQYQATVDNKLDPSGHTVSALNLTISADGKVVGNSPENGCSLLGIATLTPSPSRVDLDLTMSGCRYAGYNMRWSGSIAVVSKGQAGTVAQLNLNTGILGVGRWRAIYDLKATLSH
ncbi:MAG: hypothetical protein FD131_3156 [Rhodocyclaceae bacterium]|nr:MAG: hypothetical protein FD131_3156 [Rhodocyclaceae bacterium]